MSSGQVQLNVRDAYGNVAAVFTTPSVGQGVSSQSSPVVLASDQSNVAVVVQGTANVTVSGVVTTSPQGNVVVQGNVALIGSSNVAIQGTSNTQIIYNGALVTNANPIPIIDGFTAPNNVVWTSGTALNTAVTLNTAGFDTAIVTLTPQGTITGGAATFELFDGYSWVPTKAPRTDSYVTDTTFTFTGAGIHSWQVPVSGYPQLRLRLSTAIVGTGNVSVTTITSSAPDVSLVTVGMDPASPLPSGNNTLGSLMLTNGYTDSNTVLGATATFTGTGRQLANSNFCYFKAVSFSDQTGTLYIDQSLDNQATWRAVVNVTTVASTGATATIPAVGAQSGNTFYRVRYTNGATLQTIFNLASFYSAF